MQIDVILSASQVTSAHVTEKTAVVVDVFRATSVMITALHHGAKQIVPVVEVAEALAKRDELVATGTAVVLGGERHMRLIEGFDKDNSPRAYTPEVVADKTIVLSTTNGTRAVNAALGAKRIYIGALLNVDAVCERVAREGDDAVIICSGRHGEYTLEDALCAGKMVARIQQLVDCKASDVAWSLAELYRVHAVDLRGALEAGCLHYSRMKGEGIEKDVDFCLQEAIWDEVPFRDADGNIHL